MARRLLLAMTVACVSVAAGLLSTAPLATAAPLRTSTSKRATPDTIQGQGCSVQTIPAGDNTVAVTAFGANGTAGYNQPGNPNSPPPGGSGAGVSATVTYVTGQLDVCVDVGGSTGNSVEPGHGNGGGASGVSLGADFSHPVVVAGGGGGGAGLPDGVGCNNCGSGAGGNAAYPSGSAGAQGEYATGGGAGGGGGTQTGGGGGGLDNSEGVNAPGGSCSSSSGPGGGGSDNGYGGYGGGGGGGYCGGGAGGGDTQDNGGGGGGSDFCTNSVAPQPPSVSGCSEGGDGLYIPEVILSFSYTAPAPTVYVNDGGSGNVIEVPGWGAAPFSIGNGSPTASYGNFEYNNAAGLALDPAGDVFTPNDSAGTINEIPAGGGNETTIAGGISTPNAVAGDNSNDLLVATAYGVQPVLDGNPQNNYVGDTAPGTEGVAVDAVGDVFIADTGYSDSTAPYGRIVEVPADGSPQRTIYGDSDTSSQGKLQDPGGVAVDSAGDVFIADTYNNRVLKVTPAGTATTVASNLSDPEGVALDAYGNVFVANAGANDVVEVPAGGGAQTTIGSGFAFNDPSGLAVYAPPPTFANDTPPGYAAPNSNYSYTYTAQAQPNQPAPTFAVASGQLPPGLSLNPTTGVLSGTIPSGGPWTFQVQTENVANATASPPTTIVTAAPTVTGVSPTAGPTSAGTPVTITGTNFATGSTTVDFGSNAPATAVQVQSPTTLTALAPAGDPGSVDVTVTTPGGTSPTSSADQYTYVAGPTVSQVSPNVGPIAGGNTVTITGTNFASGATVDFGSGAATSVDFESSTELTAVAPAGGYGAVDVTVTTPQGGTSATSSADQYTYGQPTVSAVSPTSGPAGGGNTVTITGTNFASGATVDFGTNAGTSVNVKSATRLTALAPAGTGKVNVTVTTPQGGTSATSSADSYTYLPPAGAVFAVDTGYTAGAGSLVQLVPGGSETTLAGGQGDPAGVAVDAAGDVFVAEGNPGYDIVEYPANGSAERTLTSAIDPVSIAVDARGDVFTGDYYGVQEFPVGGGPVKTLDSSISEPMGVAVDAQGDVFASGAQYQNDGDVVELHPPNWTQTTVASGLNNPQALAVDLKGDVFIVANGSNQVVEVPAGGGTQTTVGSGLQDPTGVAMDAAGNVFISEVNPGYDVVEDPAGGGAQTTLASNLVGTTGVAAYAPAPTFTADTPPDYAPVGKAYSYTYTARAPAGEPNAMFALASGELPPGLTLNPTTGVLSGTPTASGTYTFLVQTQNAVQRSLSPRTEITTSPAVTKVSPDAGPTSGGGTVTITGTGFVPGATVEFGTVAATNVTYKTAASLTATAPAQAAGAVRLSVRTAAGISPITPADQYAYGPPTITKVSPAGGSTTGGGTVTITGTNFVPGARVAFGAGNYATNVTYKSTTTLTATAPAHTPAAVVNVYVLTAAGTSPASQNDLYAYGAPTVTKVSPAGGPTAGGGTVTITGSGFVPGATVKFGTVAATNVTYKTATALTATAPAQAAGAVRVSVDTAAGISPITTADQYAYGPPTITKLSPSAGPTVGGGTVTITGRGFVPGATVKFGTVAATNVTYKTATALTATAPAQAAGAVRVSVDTAAGISPITTADTYTYTASSSPVATPASHMTAKHARRARLTGRAPHAAN